MGSVSYHVRVDEAGLNALRQDPEAFWDIEEHFEPNSNTELVYLDKDWMTLAWLLSPKAREEQKHDVVLHAVTNHELPDEEWHAAKAEAAKRLGLELVDTGNMPDDKLLRAIQGRTAFEDSELGDLGYGGHVFTPEQVTELAAALATVQHVDLKQHFDPKKMEELDVSGILWTEEPSTILEEVL